MQGHKRETPLLDCDEKTSPGANNERPSPGVGPKPKLACDQSICPRILGEIRPKSLEMLVSAHLRRPTCPICSPLSIRCDKRYLSMVRLRLLKISQ